MAGAVRRAPDATANASHQDHTSALDGPPPLPSSAATDTEQAKHHHAGDAHLRRYSNDDGALGEPVSANTRSTTGVAPPLRMKVFALSANPAVCLLVQAVLLHHLQHCVAEARG